MVGASSGELGMLLLVPVPEVSKTLSPYSAIANWLAFDNSWGFPNDVAVLPTARAISFNGALSRIKCTKSSSCRGSADPRAPSKNSSKSLWFDSSWIVRLTATLRLRSRVGSKRHLVLVVAQALHGASGPEHYNQQKATISLGHHLGDFVPMSRDNSAR